MKSIIGFIGAGNMAGAIIDGIVKGGLLKPAEIATYNVHEERRNAYAQRGFIACGSVAELVEGCQYVVLSVKPQMFAQILAELKPIARPDQVFISIAAGISAKYIKESLGFDAKIILAMPNTPLLIGCGTTAISRVEPTDAAEFSFIRQIFSSAGSVEEISPDKMNEVIPLNGSSPAFIYLFAKVFSEHAVTYGFDADTANRLFCETLIGSAKMMLQTGKSHQELIAMVTSPGGTTFEGLAALERGGFEKILNECFDDTVRRAYELGR